MKGNSVFLPTASRLHTPWLLCIVYLISVANAAFAQNKALMQKPNIVVIVSDDQRYNTIHALGGKEIHTPNLDSLVSAGTTFSHAFNMGAWHGAICVASRTMLITGLSVWEAQRREKQLGEFASTSGLWSQHLKRAGYETYMAGKWHVRADVHTAFDHVVNERPGMPNQTPEGYHRPVSPADTAWTPWNKNFDGFWKGGRHWSEVLADDAVNFINTAKGSDAPFFMYLAFNAPHDPRQSPKEFVARYPLDNISLPPNYLDEYPFKEEIGSGIGLRDEQLAPFPRTAYAVKKHIQEYYASITHMDAQVGKILRMLAASGKSDNTYVFFVSDHGLAVGHHGLMGKQSMFDHSVRVPLIVSGKNIPKGQVRDQQVYLQDIMPTTLELAGIEIPRHVYFKSLLPLVEDKTRRPPYNEVYGGYMNTQRMVRTEQHKLIVYPFAEKVLLFDLAKDPSEMHDVSGEPPYRQVLSDMKERLLRQQAQLGDTLDLTSVLNKYPVIDKRERHGPQIDHGAEIDSLASDDFIEINGGLDNFFLRIKNERQATVAFFGGSITAGKGWRDHVQEYLESKFPETKWTFINAGIPSLGSVPHAFRLDTDVLTKGRVDLLFVESAVNDLANGTPVLHQRRALEGIVRHARRVQPTIDIVLMAFADEPKNNDYASGKIPQEVTVHREVAAHYNLPFINLAREVFDRIQAGEFTWKEDFVDLHPSPFGHQLYFRTIRRMFQRAQESMSSRIRPAKARRPIDASAFSNGHYVPVSQAKVITGFEVDPAWNPDDHAKARKRFVNVPMLVGTKEGSTVELSFEGNAAGIAVVSGPDAGEIRFSIDGGQEQTVDLYTQWSRSLHLPWYLILADGLHDGAHRLKIILLASHNPKATGSACRIVHFLVNLPEN